jgi:hypothetical protein
MLFFYFLDWVSDRRRARNSATCGVIHIHRSNFIFKLTFIKSVIMSLKTKVAFLLILVFGLQFNLNGQTITFNILMKMVDSRQCKDSVVNAFNLIHGAHIPGAVYGTESEYYMTRDSSKTIIFFYQDSANGCLLFARDKTLLHNIISEGQIDGFAKANGSPSDSGAAAYTKGIYRLVFNEHQKKLMPRVILIKHYRAYTQ